MTDRETHPTGGPTFDALLGRLARVPKSELAAEEEKYRQMRERLREKGRERGTVGEEE